MASQKSCPECGSNDLLTHSDISARGGYGPDLLPGSSGLFTSPKLRAVVCKDCGLIRYYAAKETLQKLIEKGQWNRLL